MAVVERNRLSEDETRQVKAQLERVLESSFFSGSQRCSRFLQYSVENVLAGCPHEDLKERIIGVEVFHRHVNYDTGQDSTVRVTANEVRKRLAQYYAKAAIDDPIIELAAGSYAVTFRWRSTKAARSDPHAGVENPAQNQHVIPRLEAIEAKQAESELLAAASAGIGRLPKTMLAIAGIAIALLIAAVVIALVKDSRRPEIMQDVWGSLLDSRKPVTICVAQPIAYRPSSGMENITGPEDSMVALPNAFVGVGDAYAVANITAFWGSQGKPWYLLPSTDTSFRDLATGPIILIGSFSNPWTSKLADSLRFVFVEGPPNRLVDKAHPQDGWTIQVSPQWTTPEDYAIISKFRSPDTGETILSLAGATNFGTEAAGNFLTNPATLLAAFRDAPKDWRTKNFQIVLHLKVQGSAPEQPTVVAKYFW